MQTHPEANKPRNYRLSSANVNLVPNDIAICIPSWVHRQNFSIGTPADQPHSPLNLARIWLSAGNIPIQENYLLLGVLAH